MFSLVWGTVCMGFVLQMGYSLRYFPMQFSDRLTRSISPKGSMLSMSTTSAEVSSTPTTFIECARRAGQACRRAYDDGERLLEVEFPPLPLQVLEDSSSSARDIADANTRWAIEFAKSFTDLGQVSIIYPDQPELDDAIIYVDSPTKEKPFENVTLATIRADSIKNAASLDQIIMSVFGATVGGKVEAVPNTKVYVAVVSSTQELPDLRKLHEIDPTIPIIFFNLKLDQLRGDLGLPVFPNRNFHYEFLCKIRPGFLMRQRAFSTSLRRPPFVLNYSGLLYRCYPEKFQSILNTGNGKTKLVKVTDTRPTSAEFRDYLIGALDLPGFPKEELRTNAPNLWWENDLSAEKFSTWRQ